jgi:hypothetical protein
MGLAREIYESVQRSVREQTVGDTLTSAPTLDYVVKISGTTDENPNPTEREISARGTSPEEAKASAVAKAVSMGVMDPQVIDVTLVPDSTKNVDDAPVTTALNPNDNATQGQVVLDI